MRIIKRKIQCLARIHWKKRKKSPQKVKGGKLLHSVIKVKIVCHYFVDNFFCISFVQPFSTDSKSALLGNYIAFLKKFFLFKSFFY
jgi:hypothetical protein